jgi:hypothetical protein
VSQHYQHLPWTDDACKSCFDGLHLVMSMEEQQCWDGMFGKALPKLSKLPTKIAIIGHVIVFSAFEIVK